ncbi:hypothetical protein pb186bvf_004207 [Paramecium bursaria]
MPKDARGKNRKFGQHKDRQFEAVNEGDVLQKMEDEKDLQKEEEQEDDQEKEEKPEQVEEQDQEKKKKKKKKKSSAQQEGIKPPKQKRNLDLPESEEEDESQFY